MLCKLVAGADHVPSTSPSVYVAYIGLYARTGCNRFDAGLTFSGDYYNTTLAYQPDDLSTSHCVYGSYTKINYTELQYPPPLSHFGVCYYQTDGWHNPTIPKGAPVFSYPPDVSLLIPSWKSCTMSQQGAFDPPQRLDKATAMARVTSSPLPAVPAAIVVPAHAPATPTPDPKVPHVATLTAASPVNPAHPGSNSDPGKSGLGSEQGQQNSGPPKSGGPEAGQTPPSSFHPAADNSPSNNIPSNSDPSKNDPGSSSNNIPHANKVWPNDPSIISFPGSGQSSNNDPASNNYPSNGNPSKNNLKLLVASPNSPSPQVDAQSPTVQSHSPASGNLNNANLVPPQGLGAQIASAFGYVPGSTVSFTSVAPHRGPTFIIAGQTLAPGGAAITVSGIPISLPASPTLAPNLPAIAIEASALSEGGPALGVTPVTIGNQVFTPNPPAFVIAGNTISAGGQGATIAGTPISLQPSGAGLVIGSSTLAVTASAASPGSPTPITIGTQVFTPDSSAFEIAGTTISAGGPGVTVAGTFISLQASGARIVVGSSTLTLPSQSITPDIVTIGNQVFTPNPTGFSIASTTMSAGGPGITVDGTVVSLEASGGRLVVGSNTLTLGITTASQRPMTNAVTKGNQVFTPNPTGFSIAGTVISVGGPGVTVDGTVVSLEASGMGLVIGSITMGLQGTGMSTVNATSNPNSGAVSAITNIVAGDTTSISSVISTTSGGSTTASSQPTRAVSSGGYTQTADLLIFSIASIFALCVSAGV